MKINPKKSQAGKADNAEYNWKLFPLFARLGKSFVKEKPINNENNYSQAVQE
jgi:hypothetical protein